MWRWIPILVLGACGAKTTPPRPVMPLTAPLASAPVAPAPVASTSAVVPAPSPQPSAAANAEPASPEKSPRTGGELAWLRRFEHAKRTPNYKARGGQTYSLRNPEHSRIAVDASGDFVVGTTHRGTIDFGAGALVNDSVIAFAIAKISPDGKTKWSRQLKPTKSVRAIAAEVRAIPGGTSIRDLVIDRAGNIVMAGEYSRYVGGLPRGSKKRTPRYVAWFSGTDGKLLRAATLGETPPITVNGILPLDDGSVVLSGFHSGLYDFGNPGAVAVKLDAKGKETWRHRLMDSGRSAWVSDAVVKEDGSYLLLGGRYAEGYNMWFGKLAADGTPPTELVHTLTQVNPATERALTNDLVIDDEGRGLTMGAI